MPGQDPPASVVRERTLDAPPDEVWETLTDEALLALWLAADVELDLREGGRARFAFDDGEVRDGEVERVEPAQRLSWSWWSDGTDRGHVEFHLRPEGPGTRLVVIETRISATAPTAAPRWAPALSSLARMHSRSVCV